MYTNNNQYVYGGYSVCGEPYGECNVRLVYTVQVQYCSTFPLFSHTKLFSPREENVTLHQELSATDNLYSLTQAAIINSDSNTNIWGYLMCIEAIFECRL